MLKIYNSLTGEKEVFKPRKGKKVHLFVCGPTVYDFSHLGHGRTYIFYDMLAGYLKFLGYKVFYLENITDVDDKIIKRARERRISWKDIAEKYEKEYLEDMKNLKVDNVSKYAKATSYIKEIKKQVKELLKKGYAYQIEDGVYYNIKKFSDYGKLSGRTVGQAEDGISRIDMADKKNNKGDFCLWKISKPDEPTWHSDWGEGRPGWHIEDTAITEKYFGFQYDIHGGARDLIFPHHEAEIAQMEAISGKKPMAKYWIHAGFLTVNGQKMSKSLGNFITIRDFLKKWRAEALRFAVFSVHYRSPLDYSEKMAEEAETNLKKITEFLRKLRKIKNNMEPNPVEKKIITDFKKYFFAALEDDFNFSKAKGLMFDFIGKINKKIGDGNISQTGAKKIYGFFKEINKIFKFLNFKQIEEKQNLPRDIKKLASQREIYRKKRNWQRADELRQKIEDSGYSIKDGENGPIISSVMKKSA